MAGWFDKMFDFDHDGKMNWIESAAKYAFLQEVMEGDKKKNSSSASGNGNTDDDWDDDCEEDNQWDEDGDCDEEDQWDEDVDCEEDNHDELENDLIFAGLDPMELEMMDEIERREAIEDAGLDPDDYEEFF